MQRLADVVTARLHPLELERCSPREDREDHAQVRPALDTGREPGAVRPLHLRGVLDRRCPPARRTGRKTDGAGVNEHEVAAAVDASGGRLLALSMGMPQDGFVGAIVAADDFAELDRLGPVLDEADRRGSFVLVHPGPARLPAGAPGWWAPAIEYTAQMQRAYGAWLASGVERWPNLRMVFSILAGGAPFQLERMQARGYDIRKALHPSLYLETSSYGRRSLELCLATFGARQIVFGSDAPVIDVSYTLEHVRSFGQAALDALCRDNPTALLA